MNYLFLVTIGPVQDFIASARRTRDLHFGSWFLSELARAAAHEIVAHNGLNSLIFPAPASAELLMPYNEKFIVANKIIARVEQPPQILGSHVRQAVFTQLRGIRDDAYKSVYFQGKMRSISEAQVEDLVEILWVALPFDGQEYQRTRKRLEALMAARKNTRDFGQTTAWQAAAPKSSIDGRLESVIPEQAYPSASASEEDRRTKIRLLYEDYGAGPAERLSGVDLLKRNGITAFGSRFPSTSHMATVPFLERLKMLKNKNPQLAQVQSAWDAYIRKVQQLAFTSQLERIPDR
jgi:CRISPR-associated protein Cmr2